MYTGPGGAGEEPASSFGSKKELANMTRGRADKKYRRID